MDVQKMLGGGLLSAYNNLIYVIFRHNNTPHSVVSNFCFFECLLYGEHIIQLPALLISFMFAVNYWILVSEKMNES